MIKYNTTSDKRLASFHPLKKQFPLLNKAQILTAYLFSGKKDVKCCKSSSAYVSIFSLLQGHKH